jgi:hypothetical protein
MGATAAYRAHRLPYRDRPARHHAGYPPETKINIDPLLLPPFAQQGLLSLLSVCLGPRD